jgi:hypothetical protein
VIKVLINMNRVTAMGLFGFGESPVAGRTSPHEAILSGYRLFNGSTNMELLYWQ